ALLPVALSESGPAALPVWIAASPVIAISDVGASPPQPPRSSIASISVPYPIRPHMVLSPVQSHYQPTKSYRKGPAFAGDTCGAICGGHFGGNRKQKAGSRLGVRT